MLAFKIVDTKKPSLLHFNMTSTEGSYKMEDNNSIKLDLFSGSETRLVDIKELTVLSGSDSLAMNEAHDIMMDNSGAGRLHGFAKRSQFVI